MLRILLFGGLSVSRDDQRQVAPSATQPRRLAILAMIASAGERGLSRERLHSLFWPDADDGVARRGLTQALYGLRTGTDEEELLLGVQELRLNREVATCDVVEYLNAIDGGELERAAAMYQGSLLDGFRLPGAPDFDRRMEEQRAEFATRHEALLEKLAVRATKRGDADRATHWWRQRAAMDHFNPRVAEAYMRALVAAGDEIGAIRHARVHMQLLEQEFGTAASPAVTKLMEQLQTGLKAPTPPAPVPCEVPATHIAGVPVAPATAAAPVPADAAAPALAPAPALATAPAPALATALAPAPASEPATVAEPAPAVSPPVTPAPAALPAVSAAPRPSSRRFARHAAMLAGGAIAIIVALVLWNARRVPAERTEETDLRRLRVSEPSRLAADAMFELDPAISPDGQRVAYVVGNEGAMRLYVRQRDGGRAVPVAESVEGDHHWPRWSPDGASIAFQAAAGIWVVPAFGGSARLIVEASQTPRFFAPSPVWSPDGADIAWANGDSVYRINVGTGVRRALAYASGAHSLAWSPDGRWIAAVSGNSQFAFGAQDDLGRSNGGIGNLAPSAIVLVPAAGASRTGGTGDTVRLLVPPLTLNMSPAWLDKHTLIFVSKRGGTRDLFAVRINDVGTMRGDIERITAGLDVHSVTASTNGERLAYAVFRQAANVWSIPLRPNAPVALSAATRVTEGTQVIEGIDVTRDGRWLAFDADVSGQQDIFRLPVVNGAAASRDPERIVASAFDDFHPAWSPDGRWLAFYTFRDNVRRGAYTGASGGTVRFVQPTDPSLEEHSPIWTFDSKSLIFFRGDSARTNLFRTDRLNDTTWSPPSRLTKSGGFGASFSTDGRQMVYATTAGTVRLTDSTLRESASRVLLERPSSTRSGPVMTSARITPDGRALILKGYDDSSSGFWWYPLVSGVLGAPRLLVRFDDPRRSSPRPEFTTDGRFLYFTLAEREADVWVLKLERR